LTIHRFPVDKHSRNKFNLVNNKMLGILQTSFKPGVSPVPIQESGVFVDENINSVKLLKFLKRNKNKYHAFIFIPYLYGPILKGLQLVSEKAYLQPCLHDEVYAYLPEVERNFRIAKGILYNSEGESRLADYLYGPGISSKGIVIGGGVEDSSEKFSIPPTQVSEFNLRQINYVLYLGRRDQTKNIDLLIQAYLQFKKQYPSNPLKLVLAGPGTQSYSNNVAGLIDLGLVSEDEKAGLLAYCKALFQPSKNESYSRVLMEAWFYDHPVAAHRCCRSTALAVETAGGGWLADHENEWVDLFGLVDRLDDATLTQIGKKGHAYANKYAVWETVIDRYEKFLDLSVPSHRPYGEKTLKNRSNKLSAIHQITPCLATGDAISNQALIVQKYLHSLGYESNIYVESYDPSLSEFAKVLKTNGIENTAGLIYHHSIGCRLTRHAIDHPYPKCLVYHNITPPEFVKPYDPSFSKLLEEGRAELKDLSTNFSISVGDSAYNVSELQQFGFQSSSVLPICIDPDKWNQFPDVELMTNLQDGRANIIFVGRVFPNKCQHHLINAFYHYLHFDPDARLIIVGELLPGDTYSELVFQHIEELGLTDYIIVTGKVSDKELQAYYRTSHLYWSMSEHEGFGVPLIEAMWFDIPVLAYKSSAVPETLDKAGVIFTTKDDLDQVAALAKLCVRDNQLRKKILTAQRRRRLEFLPQVISLKIKELANRLEKQIQ
jgi:glycosyltransferase involved in cell wall biosynthesis